MEDLSKIMSDAKTHMDKAIEHLRHELAKLRTGKASTNLLEDLKVEYYGGMVSLNRVANLQVSDARTLVIQPWEKKMLGAIERVIINSNIGMTPANDGEVIRLTVPPLTTERRQELVKKARAYGEESKVGVRNARHKALQHIRDAVKGGLPEDIGKKNENELQNLVNQYVKQIDEILTNKEREIMTV